MQIILPPFEYPQSVDDVILTEFGIELTNKLSKDSLYILHLDEETVNNIERAFKQEVVVVTKPILRDNRETLSILALINDIAITMKKSYSILVRR